MKNKGFTLIEVMLAMAIMSSLFMVVFLLYDVGFKIFDKTQIRSGIRTDVARAIDRFRGDLQKSAGITAATNRSITFWIDENNNGTESAGESHSYSFSGITGEAFILTDSDGDVVLTGNVAEFSLTYDSALVDDIHLVTFKLKAGEGIDVITIQSKVRPRNIF